MGTSDGTYFLGSLLPHFCSISSCLPYLIFTLSFADSSHLCLLSRICPYKPLQHPGEQGECKQAIGRKRAEEAKYSTRSTYSASGTLPDALCTFPHWLLTRAPPGSNPALPRSSWVTLGKEVSSTLSFCFLGCKMELYWLILA